MPLISRLTDADSGHGSFPPTTVSGASPNVFVEGLAAARQGDPLVSHGSPSPSPPHSRALASGSGTVYVNGKPLNRIGDPVGCGGVMVGSASSVWAGG